MAEEDAEMVKRINLLFDIIAEAQEKALLEYFGEKIGNEFTEQNIAEQARKVINNA